MRRGQSYCNDSSDKITKNVLSMSCIFLSLHYHEFNGDNSALNQIGSNCNAEPMQHLKLRRDQTLQNSRHQIVQQHTWQWWWWWRWSLNRHQPCLLGGSHVFKRWFLWRERIYTCPIYLVPQWKAPICMTSTHVSFLIEWVVTSILPLEHGLELDDSIQQGILEGIALTRNTSRGTKRTRKEVFEMLLSKL